MAVGAGIAIATLVDVVLAMTVDALCAAAAKMRGIDVTGAALCRLVLADQRERGARMVEARHRFPACLHMAARAGGPERIVVTVGLAMTTNAGRDRKSVVEGKSV